MSLFFTENGFKQMLAAFKGTNPTTPVTHIGAFDAGTALTSVTGANSTDLLTKSTHGLVDGTCVILSSLSGGSGVNVNKPYFVISSLTNTFQLSGVPGGAAVDLGSDIASVTVTPLIEISGGSYARQTLAFNAPATAATGATMDDSTNGAAIPIPGGSTVDYLGLFSASTSGTLMAVAAVTPESFAGDGTYTATDVDASLSV